MSTVYQFQQKNIPWQLAHSNLVRSWSPLLMNPPSSFVVCSLPLSLTSENVTKEWLYDKHKTKKRSSNTTQPPLLLLWRQLTHVVRFSILSSPLCSSSLLLVCTKDPLKRGILCETTSVIISGLAAWDTKFWILDIEWILSFAKTMRSLEPHTKRFLFSPCLCVQESWDVSLRNTEMVKPVNISYKISQQPFVQTRLNETKMHLTN